jgi:translation initiation factor 1
MKKKIDTSAATNRPLQVSAFEALNTLETSALPPGPELPPPANPIQPAAETKSLGRIVLRRETKDRSGKTVVVLSGLQDIPRYQTLAAKEELARTLRKKLGCGGTVDGYEIVLQGDRPAEVCAALEKMNFRVAGVKS